MNKLRFLIALAGCLAAMPAPAEQNLFAKTMRVHFRAAEICWKQKKVPNRLTVEQEIKAIKEVSKRWWPSQVEEAQWRLMCLMLTEGGGNKEGVKSDPTRRSYGPLHIKYNEAVLAAEVYRIGTPFIDFKKKGAEQWFKSKLRSNVKFGIECGAGFLKMCDNEANNDMLRGLLIFKCGSNGFKKLVTVRLRKKQPLTMVPVWKHFSKMRQWINCLSRQVEKNIDDPCECTK